MENDLSESWISCPMKLQDKSQLLLKLEKGNGVGMDTP
jgi:hypothetical protein